MKYSIITTQPRIYDSFLSTGLIARGVSCKIINIDVYNLHDYAFDKHKSIDDTPYGGGAGMVLKVDVVANALKNIKGRKKVKSILLTPQGKKFDQNMARNLAKEKELIIISGRFEGYDERIRDCVDEEISLGDFVLTSGDLPAMTIIDAVSRNIPGFIDRSESVEIESFSELSANLLEFPQYTRPEEFDGQKVPEILLSGDHAKIKKWREEESIKKTKERRPDLM